MNKMYFKRALSFCLVFIFSVTFLFGAFQTVCANDSGTAEPIVDPQQQAQSLGFDTTQGQRTDADGNPVDTSKNPLGLDRAYVNRISQLGVIVNPKLNIDSAIYNQPIAPDGLTIGKARTAKTAGVDNELMNMNNFLNDKKNFYNQDIISVPKATVAVDLVGIADPASEGGSTQVLVTAAIPENVMFKDYVNLQITVNDYNGGKPIHSSFVVINFEKPVGYDKDSVSARDYPIHMAAGDFDHDGKDEIAVACGNELATIKLRRIVDDDNNTVGYTWDSNSTFRTKTLIPKITGKDYARNQIDVQAGDADKDGYKDLLVCSGDTVTKTKVGKKDVPDSNPAILYIYSGTMDVEKPTAVIPLKPQSGNTRDPDKYIFTSASVDVGDPFNTGENVIVIGGRLNNESLAMTYLKYDGKGYGDMTAADYPIYNISDSALKGMKSWLPGVKCAALDGPSAGDYVVLGNILLRYDGGNFVKEDVGHPSAATKYKNLNRTYQKGDHHAQDITDIYAGGDDTTYILNTIVGNFDGNLDGREQVIMLHFNHFYSADFVFITWCGRENKTSPKISTHLTKIWDDYSLPGVKIDKSYASIAAVDVLDTGITVVAKPELTEFTFTDPSVIAVLAASPYYKELGNYSAEYAGAGGNVGTTYGTGKEKTSSSSDGISASVGVSFGFSFDLSIPIIGKKILEIEFETTITNSFTSTWTSSKSVSTSQTFTNLLADDQVVVMIIPYDIYYYEVYAKGVKEPTLMEVRIPYAPLMQNMALTYYNKITQNMPSAPKITPEVMNNHVPGDPRTYTLKKDQDPNYLSNVTYIKLGNPLPQRKKTLFYNGTYTSSLVGAGISEGLTTQEIETTSTEEQAFDYSLDINTTLKKQIGGVTAGISAGVGYSRGSAKSESNSIASSGTVASLPPNYARYHFKWCLGVYNYALATNDGQNTSECHVVNYFTEPIGTFPPAQPQNLALKDKSLTQESAVITWDSVKDAVAYYVYKSPSRDGEYQKVSTVTGNRVTNFAITGLKSGEQAYFRVSAVSDTKEGMPSEPIPIRPVEAKGISVSKQPKLTYLEGDKLDLSEMTLSILYTDGSLADVAYDKFTEKGLTVDLQNSTVLNAGDNGRKITATYSYGFKTLKVQTNSIKVSTVQSVTIGKQPQLLYAEGDKLNLTGLVVVLQFSDGKSVNIGYHDFAQNNLTADIRNETVLNAYNTGSKITVTYNNGYRNLSVQTQDISVFAQGLGDIISNIAFSYTKYEGADLLPKQVIQDGTIKVLAPQLPWGELSRATELKPDKTLYAYANIKNILTISQDVLVILALYDENGSMAGMSYLGQKIDASATINYTLKIELPSNIDLYRAKILVWDGLDLSSTNQVPKANVVQIP